MPCGLTARKAKARPAGNLRIRWGAVSALMSGHRGNGLGPDPSRPSAPAKRAPPQSSPASPPPLPRVLGSARQVAWLVPMRADQIHFPSFLPSRAPSEPESGWCLSTGFVPPIALPAREASVPEEKSFSNAALLALLRRQKREVALRLSSRRALKNLRPWQKTLDGMVGMPQRASRGAIIYRWALSFERRIKSELAAIRTLWLYGGRPKSGSGADGRFLGRSSPVCDRRSRLRWAARLIFDGHFIPAARTMTRGSYLFAGERGPEVIYALVTPPSLEENVLRRLPARRRCFCPEIFLARCGADFLAVEGEPRRRLESSGKMRMESQDETATASSELWSLHHPGPRPKRDSPWADARPLRRLCDFPCDPSGQSMHRCAHCGKELGTALAAASRSSMRAGTRTAVRRRTRERLAPRNRSRGNNDSPLPSTNAMVSADFRRACPMTAFQLGQPWNHRTSTIRAP